MKTAIFGGTFDPVHCAHLTVAREAALGFGIDKVLFVVAANPPHKPNATHAPFEDRYRMVELACEGEPLFAPSRLEEGAERSYSIHTIERVRAGLGSDDALLFIIGADAFAEIESWRRWRDVMQAVEFIVVTRPGHVYRTPVGARVHRLDTLALPVSSTDLRRRLGAGEQPAELPSPVYRYILDKHLYGA
ncbi:MAG: nicotinate (nicotinamide) nucleotide adenylyltransferase [Acidobacteria bacterium]|nr:nicotinate (nicotinamide) nucleotide adenylyltransferase [Acidobacteriota bacterium]